MNRESFLLLATLALLTTVGCATARVDGLRGEVRSAIAQVEPSGGSATLMSIGAQGFVVTQICSFPHAHHATISGSTVGRLPLRVNEVCTEYRPGIALPPNETITCTNFDQA